MGILAVPATLAVSAAVLHLRFCCVLLPVSGRSLVAGNEGLTIMNAVKYHMGSVVPLPLVMSIYFVIRAPPLPDKLSA